jgi:hypothetical protein
MAQYEVPPAGETAVATLRKAVSSATAGDNLPLLLALRQLHDPDLKPLFLQLAQSSKDWQAQVHAVLSLAEINEKRRVDAWLITQVSPQAQELIIANALDSGLIGNDQYQQILAAEDLNSMARLMLNAEQILAGEKTDQAELRVLSASDDVYQAGFAAALLAQSGDVSAWTNYLPRLQEQESSARDRLTFWLLDAIGRYKLTFARDWVRTVAETPGIEENLVFRAVYTAMLLDLKFGLDLWTKEVGSTPGPRQQMRYGLALLAVGKEVPVSAYDRLRTPDDDELAASMIDAGMAISTGADPSAAMIRLLDLGHQRATDWVQSALPKLPPDQATKVYKHLIERLESSRDLRGDPVGLAVNAVAKLYATDPDWVLDRLARAEDDGLMQQTILLGLFEADSPRVGAAAKSLRRIGSARADSLALLLIAKHSPTISEDDLKKLGVIVSGGGGVSDVLRTQAAWLYLKHTNQVQAAIGSIFAKQ